MTRQPYQTSATVSQVLKLAIHLYFKFIIHDSSRYTNENLTSVIILFPPVSTTCSTDLFFPDLLVSTSVQV